MAIQRIATTTAELTSLGGTFNTTDTSKFDPTRTRGVFKHTETQISQLAFPEVSGNTTWVHFNYAFVTSGGNQQFWGDSVVEILDASSNRLFYIDINPTNQFRANVDNGAATAVALNVVQSIGTLITIDVKIVVGATIDCEVYFNGALQGTASITNSSGFANPNRMFFGVYAPDTNSGISGEIWVGEIIVADEDTRGFRLREMTPQSFGVFQQWDGTASSVFDDSLATGVSTDVADERVSFGLDNLDAVDAGDIINRVVVQSYAQRGASGLTAMNHFFRYDDAFVQDGADIALGLTGNWYIDEYANNPRTAVAWVPTDLAGIQLGVRART